MRLLLDNPLPPSLGPLLGLAGHDAVHVGALGMHSAPDEAIFELAARDDRVVVTADTDFGTLLALRSETRPSVILIRGLAARTAKRLAPVLLSVLTAAGQPLKRGAIVVVEDGRLRVRLLPIGRGTGDDAPPPS